MNDTVEIINVPNRKSLMSLSGGSSTVFGESISDISDIPHVPKIHTEFIDITGQIQNILKMERKIRRRMKWMALADQRLRVFYVTHAEKIASFQGRYSKMIQCRERKLFWKWYRATKWRQMIKKLRINVIRRNRNIWLDQVEEEISCEIIGKWRDLVLSSRAQNRAEIVEFLTRKRVLRACFNNWLTQANDYIEQRETSRDAWINMSQNLMTQAFHDRLDRKWRKWTNIRNWEILTHGILDIAAEEEKIREETRNKWFGMVTSYLKQSKTHRLLFSSNRLHRRMIWWRWSRTLFTQTQQTRLVQEAQRVTRTRKLKEMVLEFIRRERRSQIERTYSRLMADFIRKQSKSIAKRLIGVWKENAEMQRWRDDLIYDMFQDSYSEYEYKLKDACAAKIQRAFRNFLDRRAEQRKALVKFIWAWRGTLQRMTQGIVRLPRLAVSVNLPVRLDVSHIISNGQFQFEQFNVLKNVYSHKEHMINAEIGDAVERTVEHVNLRTDVVLPSAIAMDFIRCGVAKNKIDNLVFSQVEQLKPSPRFDIGLALVNLAATKETRLIGKMSNPQFITDDLLDAVVSDVVDRIDLELATVTRFDIHCLSKFGDSSCPDSRGKDIENVLPRLRTMNRLDRVYKTISSSDCSSLRVLEFPYSLIKRTMLQNVSEEVVSEKVLETDWITSNLSILRDIRCVQRPNVQITSEEISPVVRSCVKLEVQRQYQIENHSLYVFERFEKELNCGNIPRDVVSSMSFERVYQRIVFDVPIDIITPNARCPDPDVDGIYHQRIVKISSGALQSVASLISTCSLRDMEGNVSPSQEDFADDIRIPVELTIPKLTDVSQNALLDCTHVTITHDVDHAVLEDIVSLLNLSVDVTSNINLPFNPIAEKETCLCDLISSAKNKVTIHDLSLPVLVPWDDTLTNFHWEDKDNANDLEDLDITYAPQLRIPRELYSPHDLTVNNFVSAQVPAMEVSEVLLNLIAWKNTYLEEIFRNLAFLYVPGYPEEDIIDIETKPSLVLPEVGLNLNCMYLPGQVSCPDVLDVDNTNLFQMEIEPIPNQVQSIVKFLAMLTPHQVLKDDLPVWTPRKPLRYDVSLDNFRCLEIFTPVQQMEIETGEELDFTYEVVNQTIEWITKALVLFVPSHEKCNVTCDEYPGPKLSLLIPDSVPLRFLEVCFESCLPQLSQSDILEYSIDLNVKHLLNMPGCLGALFAVTSRNASDSDDLEYVPKASSGVFVDQSLAMIYRNTTNNLAQFCVDEPKMTGPDSFESLTQSEFLTKDYAIVVPEQMCFDSLRTYCACGIRVSQCCEDQKSNIELQIHLDCVDFSSCARFLHQIRCIESETSESSMEEVPEFANDYVINKGILGFSTLTKYLTQITPISHDEKLESDNLNFLHWRPNVLDVATIFDFKFNALSSFAVSSSPSCYSSENDDAFVLSQLQSYIGNHLKIDSIISTQSISNIWCELAAPIHVPEDELRPPIDSRLVTSMETISSIVSQCLRAEPISSITMSPTHAEPVVALDLELKLENIVKEMMREDSEVLKKFTCNNRFAEKIDINVPICPFVDNRIAQFLETCMYLSSFVKHSHKNELELEAVVKDDLAILVPKSENLAHLMAYCDNSLSKMNNEFHQDINIDLELEEFNSIINEQPQLHFSISCIPESKFDNEIPVQTIIKLQYDVGISIPQIQISCSVQTPTYTISPDELEIVCGKTFGSEEVIANIDFADMTKLELFQVGHLPSPLPMTCEVNVNLPLGIGFLWNNTSSILNLFSPQCNKNSIVTQEQNTNTYGHNYPVPSIELFVPLKKYNWSILEYRQANNLRNKSESCEFGLAIDWKKAGYVHTSIKALEWMFLNSDVPDMDLPKYSLNLSIISLFTESLKFVSPTGTLHMDNLSSTDLPDVPLTLPPLGLTNLNTIMNTIAIPKIQMECIEWNISDRLDNALTSVVSMPGFHFGGVGNYEDLTDITDSVCFSFSCLLVDIVDNLVQFDNQIACLEQATVCHREYVLPEHFSRHLDFLLKGLCAEQLQDLANISCPWTKGSLEYQYTSELVQVIDLLTHTTPVKESSRARMPQAEYFLPESVSNLLDFELITTCGQACIDSAVACQNCVHVNRHRRPHATFDAGHTMLDSVLVSVVREILTSNVFAARETPFKRHRRHTGPVVYPRDDTRPRVKFLLPFFLPERIEDELDELLVTSLSFTLDTIENILTDL